MFDGATVEDVDEALVRWQAEHRGRINEVLPITTAALQAVNVPGTELDGTEVAGRTRGVRGLWVELRHRRRQPPAAGEAPYPGELIVE